MMNEITLRDLLAGLVAAGAAGTNWNLNNPTSRRCLAQTAYEMADAMIEARASVQNSPTREGGVK